VVSPSVSCPSPRVCTYFYDGYMSVCKFVYTSEGSILSKPCSFPLFFPPFSFWP
jgi:hypothetical protein